MNVFDKIISQFGKDGGEESLGAIENAVEQTPEELKLVNYVRQKIDMVRQTNSRIAQEGVMFTNVAYLLGYGGVRYDTNVRAFRSVDPKRKVNRSQFNINKVLPTIQNRLARLTQSPPKYDVRPNSNTSKDKDCARLGLEIIDDVFDKQNFTEKQQELLMCAMQGGVAYIQTTWDETQGKPMVDPETQQSSGYEGDIRLEVLNMLEVFPDPLAKTLDDAQWIIKAKVRKLDYFKERYPERGAAIKEEDVWLLSSIYDMKNNSMASGTSGGIVGAQTNQQMQNSAIEQVYYERRSKDYPNGRMVVCANGILLEDKELPIGEFDIVKFDDILIGGRYHSESIITHLRPIQDQYNVVRTKCANWIKQTLSGKYLVPKGSGLSQEALNNSDSEVVEYNPVAGASPPTAMNIPQIPQYVYEDIKTLSSEFDFISGINEATRGVSPGAAMPFRGMALLVEQDQTRIAVQTNRNEVGYSKVGCCILKYAGKFMQMPRMLKVAGDGLEYAVKEFKGEDLETNYDVIVVPGSTSPQSKVLKRQDIMNAYQQGLLGDPADPKLRSKVLKMMEFGDVSEMWKDQALDEQQVKKLISEIEEGEMPNPPGHEWDNHEVFIKELNQYRKTDKFEEMTPEQQGMITYVAEWHVNALTGLLNPQIPQQQLMAQHMVNTMEQQKAQNGGHLPMPGKEAMVDPGATVQQAAPPNPGAPLPSGGQPPGIQGH